MFCLNTEGKVRVLQETREGGERKSSPDRKNNGSKDTKGKTLDPHCSAGDWA